MAATVATVVLTITRRGLGARLAALALVGFCVVAANGQRVLHRIELDWQTTSLDLAARGAAAMQEALNALTATLSHNASTALEAPASPAGAFAPRPRPVGRPRVRPLQ